MTALLLLAAITAAIMLQLIVGVGIALWRLPLARNCALSTFVDVRTPLPAAWPGWRDFRIFRRSYEDAAQTQCSFLLTPDDGEALLPYAPGQYITIAAAQPGQVSAPPFGAVRCYSLSDVPNAKTYRITVKRSLAPFDRPNLPPGVVSTRLFDALREGDLLKVKSPSGQFVLADDASPPIVFVAGGIGVTPIISMLSWSLAHQPARSIHLFYGVRNKSEHAFKSALEDLARAHSRFKLIVLYADPGPDDLRGRDYQEKGFIDINVLKRLLPVGPHQYYVCGPPGMMASIVPALGTIGALSADIHFESFGPASIVIPPGFASGTTQPQPSKLEIQFRLSGRTVTWTGEDANLLDFAERNGTPIASGCRTGNCGSCETGLISGDVRYLRKPDYEVAAGRCLLCVATPLSNLTLEA